jgi:ribosomal protein S18 acetylase RimI-like enzyme
VTACQIVPIAEEHIPSFHEAVDIVARERKYLAFLEAPPLERAREFVLDNIARRHPQFVAMNEGSVVGWCDIIPNRSRPIYSHCGSLGIGLLPQFRGQGLGRKLLETALAAAFDFGMTRIELQVRQDNTNAISLYQGLGFQFEGVHRYAILIDGRFENQFSMALLTMPEAHPRSAHPD